MTNSRYTVTMSIAAALKFRAMFHFIRVLQTVAVPILFYKLVIYRDLSELHKFNLPTECTLVAADQQSWWMIPPLALFFAGLLLYCAIVALFYDRKNESGIVKLVSKNINSEEMVEVKI